MKDAAQANRQNAARQKELEQDIETFTQLYTKTPLLQHRKSLEQACMALNSLFTSKAEYALQKVKGRHYEQGEKAGRLLAAQLRQREVAMAIPAIKTSEGTMLTRPQDIVNEFASYYQSLYTPDAQIDHKKMLSFLSQVNLPSLSDEDRALLDGDITNEEISQAVAKLPYHKAPGEDCFPAEFYRLSGEQIIDSLYAAVQEANSTTSLGCISNKGIIAILPKPRKDPLICSSYRPISLLNCDIKILTSILASCLRKVLPSLIHYTQVGFVPGRSSRNLLRTLAHTLHFSKSL